MTTVRFPFWIVIDGLPQTDALHASWNEPKPVHAFTTGDKVTGYLIGRVVGTWKICLVHDRNALLLAIADAHQHGSVTVCFDPRPDGSGGLPVDFIHLLDVCDSEST